jgi:hypothetical protein
MEPQFYIPIEDCINDFAVHLESHPRTILSAFYGDGKSYFLDCLKKNQEIASKYTFLTIYPVNYQVEENKDIFELVKRDLLLQMILNGMIAEDYQISDSVAWYFYLQNHLGKVVESFLPFVGEFFKGLDTNSIIALYKCYSFFQNLYDKVAEFAKEAQDSSKIEKFMKELERQPSLECDPLTQIIRDNIKSWQQREGKKVVLIVEDMDRIDPAHLFRILNVLSAHMDYGYKHGLHVDESLVGNKFGVDNVVLVLDFVNLKKIFAHFYGADTNFAGYINKFATSGPYSYSFKEKRNKYIYEEIARVTGLPRKVVEQILVDSILDNMDLRRIVNAWEKVDSQILQGCRHSDEHGKEVIYSHKMLKMYVILRRLGLNDNEIIHNVTDTLSASPQLLQYFVAYALTVDSSHPFPCYINTKYNKNVGAVLHTVFKADDINEDGDVDELKQPGISRSFETTLTAYETVARSLLSFISK